MSPGGGATPTVSPVSVPARDPQLKTEGLSSFLIICRSFPDNSPVSGVTRCRDSVPAGATSEADSAETAPPATMTTPTASVSSINLLSVSVQFKV